jgi:YD repeat-containing protein
MRVIVRKSILLAVISSWWLLAIQTPARAQGWSNGYANRHTVTIDHTKVPNTDQANFSMLFSGTYAYLATTSNGGGVTNSNGYDIIFTSDANGTSVLPFEQESYNGTTGAVNYWVQIPTVSHTTDTVFYLFYGKSSVTTDQSNRNGTWDSSYKGVWHFNQTPSGTGAEKDSTVNGYNGTPASSGISLSSDGIAGSSLHFDGTSYSNNVAMSSALPGGPPLTVSIWVKTTGLNSTSASGIMDKSSWQHTGWSMWDNGQWDPHVFFRTMPNWTNEVNMNRSAVNDGNWHYLVGTINSSETITFYLDGAVYGTVSAGSIATDTADAVTVGAFQGNSAGGSLTEVRISSTVRSADWIAAEYNNVTSPWLFYDEGSPLILSLSPTPVYYGTSVTVTGKHFGSSQGTSTITFSGTAAAVTSWSDTSIVATVPFGISPGNVVVTVSGATSHVFPFNIFPTGWTDQDVGGVSKSGSASYGNDTFTVSGDGSQLWNTADAFNFAYQTLSGDGTIIARLDTLQGIGLPQAGVMIRETLTAGSTYAAVEYGNNGSGGYYPSIMWRTSTGGSTSGQSNSGDSERLPLWMKLVRSGSTFTAYESTDGVDWTQLGSSVGITMATSVYVGLFANSGDTSTLGTATFDNVSVSQSSSPAPLISGVSATTGPVGTEVQISGTNFGSSQGSSGVFLNHARVTIDSWSSTSITITIPSGATSGYLVVSVAPAMDSNPVDFTVSSQPLPDGWLDDDIGTVGISGSATYSSGTFTANGAGAGIGPTADGFHFVYQRLSGDGTIVARLASVQNAYAGVMIRETLTAGSTLAFMERGYANIGYFTYRTTTGGSTSSQQGPYIPSLPYWLKVTRSGSTFAGYTSTDGVTWTQAGTSQTITMATSVYIGLAVTSNSTSSLGTATFDNVTTTGGEPPPTPAITSISPTSGGIGASVTLAGYYFGASQGSSQIKFNGVAATSITSWSDSQIVAAVPSSATTGPVVVVVSGIGSNNNYVFTVYNPVISSLSPSTAPAGASVTLAGSGFGAAQGSSTVQFNSVAASVSSWSNTSITVTVPANAASGPVTVTEGGITSNGVQFTALGTLSISSISSSTGPIGMSVTFAGTGFGSTQGSSTATFNSIVAAVTSWSNTQIVAVVPLAASPGPVSVAVDNLTAQGPTFTPIVKATVTDSLGNSSSYTAAVNGGEWRVSGAQGSGCSSCTVRGAINYGYDAYGHVTSLTDPKGNTATYTYDSANNLLSETHPVDSTHNATSSYTYNSFGEPLTVTDALGNVTTNTYDSHGNLTSVTTPAPNGNTSASVTQFAYNSLGELSTITDPLNHVTTLTYTTAGLVATITDAQNHVTTYGYDAHGNRTSVKDANNQTTTLRLRYARAANFSNRSEWQDHNLRL